MNTFKDQCAQGDMLLRRIEKLPEGLREECGENGKFIVTHSESGHDHTIRKAEGISFYSNDNDPMIAYLVVDNTECLLEHERSFDTHAPIKIGDGIYEVRRQREYVPDGWRRAAD